MTACSHLLLLLGVLFLSFGSQPVAGLPTLEEIQDYVCTTANTYYVASESECRACHASCDGCLEYSNACLDCASGYSRSMTVTSDSGLPVVTYSCVLSCGTGYYSATVNSVLQCVKCPTGCLECSSATACSSCDSSYGLYKFEDYLINSDAVWSNSDAYLSYYGGSSDYIYYNSDGTATLMNSDDILPELITDFGCRYCQRASDAYYPSYIFGSDTFYCRTGFGSDSTITSDQSNPCLSLIGEDDWGYLCGLCKDGYYLSEGTCSDSCQSGETAVDGVCQPCWYTCDECSEGEPYDCSSCPQGLSLVEVEGTSYRTCQEVTSSSDAEIVCSDGTYYNSETEECAACSSTCLTCSGTSTSCDICANIRTPRTAQGACVSCPDYYYWVEGVCVDECPYFYPFIGYLDSVTDPDNPRCNSDCLSYLAASEGSCIEDCGDYEKQDSCDLCYAGMSECYTCSVGYFLFDGICYDICPYPTLYYNEVCRESCYDSTLEDDSFTITCKSCPGYYTLVDGLCVEDEHVLVDFDSNSIDNQLYAYLVSDSLITFEYTLVTSDDFEPSEASVLVGFESVNIYSYGTVMEPLSSPELMDLEVTIYTNGTFTIDNEDGLMFNGTGNKYYLEVESHTGLINAMMIAEGFGVFDEDWASDSALYINSTEIKPISDKVLVAIKGFYFHPAEEIDATIMIGYKVNSSIVYFSTKTTTLESPEDWINVTTSFPVISETVNTSVTVVVCIEADYFQTEIEFESEVKVLLVSTEELSSSVKDAVSGSTVSEENKAAVETYLDTITGLETADDVQEFIGDVISSVLSSKENSLNSTDNSCSLSCENGGNCMTTNGVDYCECADGYYGRICTLDLEALETAIEASEALMNTYSPSNQPEEFLSAVLDGALTSISVARNDLAETVKGKLEDLFDAGTAEVTDDLVALLDVTSVMESTARTNTSSKVPGIMVQTLYYIAENIYETYGCSDTSLESEMFKVWSKHLETTADVVDSYDILINSKTFTLGLSTQAQTAIESLITGGTGVMIVGLATDTNMAYGKDTDVTPAGGGIKVAFIDCLDGDDISNEIISNTTTYSICMPKDEFIDGEWETDDSETNSTDLDAITNTTNSTDSTNSTNSTTLLRFLQDDTTATNTNTTTTTTTTTTTNTTNTTTSTPTKTYIKSAYYDQDTDNYNSDGLVIEEVTDDEICFNVTHNTFFAGIAEQVEENTTTTNTTLTNAGWLALAVEMGLICFSLLFIWA